ncbi:MAG TPA: dihydrofolate reductase family protein [Streptosporangiaceae bacterium]|nr:dihydrofolate reductase family protein [Streptosporangiaceae bacterium]
MRRIVASTLLSLDGVIGAPHVWASDYFNEDAAHVALEQLKASDAMLMGRRTYEIFSGMWPGATGPYADYLNGMRKYVFSSTLKEADWTNTTVVSGDVPAAVADLKQQDGRDLIMYGHGQLGQTLLEHGLLDELKFAVHPLFVGGGDLLNRRGPITPLQLIGAQTLPTGVVVLTYRPTGRPGGA